MPRVSVLIPVYKPTYLSQAIASVLAQTFDDYELLISDDSPGGAAARIISQFRDPRIKVFSGPRSGLVDNSAFLWSNAQGEYVKYVYDDDFLLPWSVSRLVEVMEQARPASFAFAMRHFIDVDGRITGSPSTLALEAPKGFKASVVVNNMLPTLENFITEPTSTLFRRSVFDDESFIRSYAGFEIRHLVDVAMYLNALERGPCIAIPEFHAAFRLHADQASSEHQAEYVVGTFEWEIFVRGEFAAGRLEREGARRAVEMLKKVYTHHGHRPGVAAFKAGLPALKTRIEQGDRRVLDDAFRRAWAQASAAVELAKGQRPETPRMAYEPDTQQPVCTGALDPPHC